MDIEDIMPPDWRIHNYTLDNFYADILAAYSKIKTIFPEAWVNVKDGRRVNNWCGLRSPTCAVGARNSAHRTGEALDLHCTDLKALRDWCTSTEGLAAGIRRVEASSATPTWVHIDVRYPNPERWNDKTRPYVFMP